MRGGFVLVALLIGCSSFGTSDPPSSSSDAGADASATPAVFSVPCGQGFCTDTTTNCCNGSCITTTCSPSLDDFFCNDSSDCAALGRSGQVCCGRVEGANMVATRCAASCSAGVETRLCDPKAPVDECPSGQSCNPPSPNLNEGGFGYCR